MPEQVQALRGSPQTSLATKIILFVFVSTFATAGAVSWVAIRSSYSQARQQVRDLHPRAAGLAAAGVERWLAGGRAQLRALAGGEVLPHSIPASSYFDGLAWCDERGRPRRALGAAAALDAAALQALIAAAPLAAPEGEAGPLAAVEPRSRGDGLVIGLYRRDVVEELLASAAPADGTALLLVEPGGRVIASSAPADATAVGRVAPAAVPEPDGLALYANAAGRRVLGAAQPLDVAGWRVAFEVPFDRVFAPVVSAATRIFVIDLGLVLLSSLLAYWITTAWVKPIGTLSDTARRIAQGNLDQEIPEPSSDDEIGLLTHTFNDMIRKLRRKQDEIESANRTLRSRNEVLSQLSITDGLTHLHNHRFFQDHLGREIKRVTRAHEPLSMLLVDIDDFKGLNDRLGHAAGDELLSGMARIMSQGVRDSDLLARYGGEEFVILASDTDLQGAYQLAEKLRLNIEEASFILDDSMRPVRVTVSIGVAQFAGERKRFFEAADQALYRAKAAGKNCVVLAQGAAQPEIAARA